MEHTIFQYNGQLDIRPTFENKISLEEGLAERVTNKIYQDSLHVIWIILPSHIQSLVDNEIIETYFIDKREREFISVHFYKEEYFIFIWPDYTISVFNPYTKQQYEINDLDIKSKSILKAHYTNNDLQFLVQCDSTKTISVYKYDGKSSSYTRSAELNHEIEDVSQLDDFYFLNDHLFVLYSDGTFQDIKEDKIKEYTTKKSKSTLYPYQGEIIFYNNIMFISPGKYQGLYYYDFTQFKNILPKGHLQFYSTNKIGQFIFGMGNEPLLTDEVFIINNNIIQKLQNHLEFNAINYINSSDFKTYQMVASSTGIFEFQFGHQGIGKAIWDDNRDIVFGELVRSIVAWDNQLIALTEGGRIYATNDRQEFKLQLDLNPKNLLHAKLNPAENQIAISSYNSDRKGTIYFLDKNFIIQDSIFIGSLVRDIEFDNQDNMYIGGYDFGINSNHARLYKYNKNSGIENVYNKGNSAIRCMYSDSTLILLGCTDGLSTYHKDTKKIKTIDALKDAYISNICKHKNRFYLSSLNKGLFILDKDLKVLQNINMKDFPISNEVADIFIDSLENIWVSTFRGLGLLNKEGAFLKNISGIDGISSLEFNANASYSDEEGNLYFGTINGMTTVNLEEFYKVPEFDKTINEFVIYQNGISSNIKPTGKNETIINGLPDSISFQIIQQSVSGNLPDYAHTTILKGDNNIPVTQKNNEIKINNLDIGTYEVYQNNKSNKSKSLHSISIKRDYTTLKSIMWIGLIFALISFFAANYFIKRERKINERNNIINNKIANLRLDALRSQLNPHFIFNSLHSIQYYIQMNEKSLARNYLSKFARLMRLFLESSRSDRVVVKEVIEQLEIYLSLEKLRFEDLFTYEIVVDSEIDQLSTKIPSMIIQPFIENSILHGVSHLEGRKGKITLEFIQKEHGLLCIIDDNGVGRKKSSMINANSVKKHISRASEIIEDRVHLLNQEEANSIKIETIDKKDDSGFALGTQVSIFIAQSFDE